MDAAAAPWLIYAVGGGWGHLARSAALACAASAERRIRILTNSPYAAQVHNAMPALDLVALDPALSAADTRLETVRHIRAASPACLIVDTFPRGLGGELAEVLPSLAPCKVLVHRDLHPRYVAEAGLPAFVESSYDLILIPGEGEGRAFADLPAAATTAPWLIRSPSELQPRQPGAPPCIMVCASGRDEELAWYGAVVAQLLVKGVAVRCIAASCPPGCPREYWIAHWPAADLYAQSDVVVGGAGYNTIHECLAYGVPLIARPWPRTYDRQWLRAQQAAQRGSVTTVEHPEEAALAAIRQLDAVRPPRPPVEFQNGAGEAAALILRATQPACAPDPRSP
jgi:hypothetical protein